MEKKKERRGNSAGGRDGGGQKPLRKYDFLVEELTAEGLAQLDRHNKKREPGGVTAPTSPAR